MRIMSPDFDQALATADGVVAEPVRLPSGRLIAAEPPGLFPAGEVERWAFAETVPPGEYPVEVLRADNAVVAARVIVRAEPVHEWRPAACARQPKSEHSYFPVEAGTGSFGSVEVFEALTDPESAEDLIDDFSFDRDEPFMTYADQETGANLIAFTLGGSGRFETWVGYGAAGEVACFLTDYGNLA
jgi:hypothetical protein